MPVVITPDPSINGSGKNGDAVASSPLVLLRQASRADHRSILSGATTPPSPPLSRRSSHDHSSWPGYGGDGVPRGYEGIFQRRRLPRLQFPFGDVAGREERLGGYTAALSAGSMQMMEKDDETKVQPASGWWLLAASEGLLGPGNSVNPMMARHGFIRKHRKQVR